MGKAMSVHRNVISIQTSNHRSKPTFPSAYAKDKNAAIQGKTQDRATAAYREETKDFALNERLKHIYVTSEKGKNLKTIPPKKNLLPTSKTSRTIEAPHSQTSESMAPTKLTLNELNSLLSANQNNPAEWTPSRMSEHFKINKDDAEKLLRYFGYFEVYVPSSEELHANETVSGGKIEKAEPVPKRMSSSTDFNEMQKIMGFRKKVFKPRE